MEADFTFFTFLQPKMDVKNVRDTYSVLLMTSPERLRLYTVVLSYHTRLSVYVVCRLRFAACLMSTCCFLSMQDACLSRIGVARILSGGALFLPKKLTTFF